MARTSASAPRSDTSSIATPQQRPDSIGSFRRSSDLAQPREAFRAVGDPEEMPADAVVFEELGVGAKAITDDRRPFGRLVDFDEDEGRGLAGIDDDEMVGVDAPVVAGDEPFGPPELDEPRIVANERGDELHAVERVAGRDESGRSIGVEVNAASSG